MANLPSWLPQGYDWRALDNKIPTAYDSDGNATAWNTIDQQYQAAGQGGQLVMQEGWDKPQWYANARDDGNGMFSQVLGHNLGGVVDDAWPAIVMAAATAGAGTGAGVGADGAAVTTPVAAQPSMNPFQVGVNGAVSSGSQASQIAALDQALATQGAGTAASAVTPAATTAATTAGASLPTLGQTATGLTAAAAANSLAGNPLNVGNGGAGGEAAPGSLSTNQMNNTGLYDSSGTPLTNNYGGSTDLASVLRNLVSNPSSVLNGTTLGGTLNSVLNYLNQNRMADAYTNIGNQQIQLGRDQMTAAQQEAQRSRDFQSSMAERYNPLTMSSLNQTQRQPYQQQLSDLVNNPSSFFSTNPMVQAHMDLARQQFEANTGKMGTGGTQFNDYLHNVMNYGAEDYNSQIGQLSTLGGFTFAPGGGTTTGANTQGNVGAGSQNFASATNPFASGVGSRGNALQGFSQQIGNAPSNNPFGTVIS